MRAHLADRRKVFEIGAVTGQHAVHFAAAMSSLVWQCVDRTGRLDGMRLWLAEAALPNTPAPLAFDVNDAQWPDVCCDAVYTANTLHIMSWPEVERLCARLPELLAGSDAKLAICGPFNYGGCFTSDSNAAFDAKLRAEVPHVGIRDFEVVDALARAAGFALIENRAMPAKTTAVSSGGARPAERGPSPPKNPEVAARSL